MTIESTRIHTWLHSDKNLPWLGALVAAFIAGWVNYHEHGVINNDGILYLEVARLFDGGQWRQGFATYNWPFYSLLIMLTHKITGLGLHISANVLSIIFFSLTSLGVATLIHETGGDRKTVMAGLALLFSAPYLIGDILPMVVREHGYWATHLWSVVFLVRFLHKDTWKYAFLWGFTALASMLFRIEGLIYLALLPAVVLVCPSTPLMARLKKLLKVNIVAILLGFLLVAMLTFHPTLQLKDMGRLGDPLLILQLVYTQLAFGLENRTDLIAQALGKFLDSYAMPTLLMGMMYIILAKAATVSSLFHTLLALAFWKKTRNTLTTPHFRLFVWLLVLSLVSAAVILIKGFVLPKRILAPIAFVTIIFAAHGIASLLDKAGQNSITGRNPWRWAIIIVAMILSLQAVVALYPSSPKKQFERNAVAWALTKANGTHGVYLHSDRLRFYAGLPMIRTEDWKTIREKRWRQKIGLGSPEGSRLTSFMDNIDHSQLGANDYLVFSLGKGMSEAKASLDSLLGKPVGVFKGPKDNQTLVYPGLHSKPR